MKLITVNEDLNKLILSQILNEDIYVVSEKKVIQKNTSREIDIVGTIKKEDRVVQSILIVLDKVANKEELDFLSKILAALKMTIDDVLIISKQEFYSEMKFKKLLTFNVSTEELTSDIKTEKYIVKEVEKTEFLYADSLEELNKDVKKKKQLWEALQLMFIKK